MALGSYLANMFHSWALLMLEGPGEFLKQYHSDSNAWQVSPKAAFIAFKHRPMRLEEKAFGKASRTKAPLLYSNKAMLSRTLWRIFTVGFLASTTGDKRIESSEKNFGSRAEGGLEEVTMFWLLPLSMCKVAIS